MTIDGLRNVFRKLKESSESKSFKVNLGRAIMMVSGGITKDGMPKSTPYSCGLCDLRVMAISVLCVQ